VSVDGPEHLSGARISEEQLHQTALALATSFGIAVGEKRS
jgi:hypothetical protein